MLATFQRKPSPVTVVHFGLFGDEPGGMNQVVNEYLTWTSEDVHIDGQLTTRRKRDWAGVPLVLAAVARLFLLRLERRRVVAVFHLSEGGSFVREGGLLLVAKALGLPSVAHLHGADFVDFSHRRPKLVQLVLERATIIVSLTDATLDRVQALCGTHENLYRVPNLVSVPALPVTKHQIVLFCGQVSRRKGYDVLADAWSTLPADLRKSWTLHVAGPVHPDCAGVHPPDVVVHGAVTHEEALALQERAAVACLPSRAEALPMFLLEAMARACAVLATDVGQVSGLLSDGAGIVVAPDNAAKLAAALQDLLGDPDARVAMAERGRARVERSFAGPQAQQSVIDVWLKAVKQ